jgi:hypothetical protein
MMTGFRWLLSLIPIDFLTLNRLIQIVAFLLLALFMGEGLLAEEKIVTGKFVVSLTAEGDQKVWVVNALEQNIYNDLSGYEKVVSVAKDLAKEKKCKNRSVDCIVKIYKKFKVDALMLGNVNDSELDYEIYDIQNNFLVKTGSIDIGSGSSLLKLRMGAFNAFKPFLEKGGILDKRKYSELADDEIIKPTDQTRQSNSNVTLQKSLLILLAIFTTIPYLLSLIGKPRKHPARLKIVLRWFYPFLIVSLSLIAYQFILVNRDSGTILNNLFGYFEGYHWVLTGLGGILWGYFLMINLKIVVPHLQGIERISPYNLLPLLKASLVTIVIKTSAIAVVYSGVLIAVYYAGKLFLVNPEVIVLLLLPLTGIYFSYWLALMLDVFSMSIDVKLCGEKLDLKSVWNLKTRNYFIGYLKRNGVTLNRRLVENTLFLAGDNKGVVCYGGGFYSPRITIDRELIKFALGDIDEFNPLDTFVFTIKVIEPVRRQSSVFQFIPTWSDEGISTSQPKSGFNSRYNNKRARIIENAQQFFQRDLNLPISRRRSELENVLQGVVYPHLAGEDNFPSLMSENADDMRVVEKLLLQNSLRASPFDEDAEIDDSSEQDKDFLFGTLLHKFGGLIRHEEIFSTIHLYFFYKTQEQRQPYNFLFSKFFAVVADTFVVLNFGLNHLIQHLYYQATGDESFLTTKGITSGMLKSQDKILTRTKELIDERKTKTMQSDELDRIVWLSRFSQDPIEQRNRSNTIAERVVKWSISFGAMYLLAMVVLNAYQYHATYLKIIENEKQQIAEAVKAEKERERKEL